MIAFFVFVMLYYVCVLFIVLLFPIIIWRGIFILLYKASIYKGLGVIYRFKWLCMVVYSIIVRSILVCDDVEGVN